MSQPSWNVVELRRYTLRPGRRDELIDLFERHLVTPQEEAGMRLLGRFRDLDDPDRFIWLRAFTGMADRAESLAAFYERHPAWQTHREAANATMADSDDVLLLRPVTPVADRPPAAPPGSLVTALIHPLGSPEALEEFTGFYAREVHPVLAEADAAPLLCLRTEYAENTYPRLPVRTGEHVFVTLTAFAGADAHRAHLDRLGALPHWRERVIPGLTGRLAGRLEGLRLAPTAGPGPR
ncbi:NIPSNAP family protein [Streptomyces sp. NPDC052396]|uniref:NIPSNAP family protein n=1 Tax=Streptomyces sp. NPDC052396 TaxID=3365689 RepID=UPI0037D8D378